MEYQRYQLRDIGDIVSGATPKTTVAENFGGAIPWLTPADLSGYTQKYISRGKRNLTQLGYDSCSTQIMPSGTVLFSSRAPIGYTAIAKNPICTNQGFKSIVPKPFVNSEFLYYQLIYLRKTIQDMGSGTTFKEISAKKFGAVQVTIPPLVEQEHIISRIEELFFQLDVSVNELKTAKERLKVYRQAVLKEAFGEVTTHTPFGEIIDARLGKMLDKEKNTGDFHKYLRNINVRWFSFDLSDLLEMRIEADEIEKYSVSHNDLIICEGGEPGRCAVWDKPDSIFYQKALHRVRFLDNSNPRFYMYYLWFSAQAGQLCRYFTGTGIKHLTGQSLSKVIVPTADRTIQDSIVAEIESHLSVCDSIQKTVDTALQQAEALRQSILKKAFEGEMV